MDLLRCLYVVLPAAIFWGASFPLALAAAARPGQDPGRLVAGVYAANTVGAIAGALAFSLLLIPAIGSQWSQRIMLVLAAPVGGRVPGPGGLAAAREARSDCDRARNGAAGGHRARGWPWR